MQTVVEVEDQVKMEKIMVIKEVLVHKIQVLTEEMEELQEAVETLVLVVEEQEDYTEEVLVQNLVMTFHQQVEEVEVQIQDQQLQTVAQEVLVDLEDLLVIQEIL